MKRKKRVGFILAAGAALAAGLLALLAGGCGGNQPTINTSTGIAAAGYCGEDIDTTGHQYITNGTFEAGTTGWQIIDTGQNHTNTLTTVSDTSCGDELVLTRQDSKNAPALIGLTQDVRIDKDVVGKLKLQMVLIVDHQDEPSDGNLGGDTPVFITLDYKDAAGGTKSWSHGFQTASTINYPHRDQKITPNYWYTYNVEDVFSLIPDAVSITDVAIGGSGWNFTSRVSHVGLSSK